MALLFCDSFTHYNNANGDMAKKWTSVTTPGNTSTDTRQDLPGGGSNHLLNIGGSVAANFSPPSTYATGILGGWFMLTASQYPLGGNYAWFNFSDTGTTQCGVGVTANGNLWVQRNGTTLAISARRLPLNQWFHCEFKATINNTTGVIEARIDGDATERGVPQMTSQNTRTSANNYFNQIQFWASMNTTGKAKGLYLLDTSGTVGNDFLGPAKVAALRPVGKGNYNQWTAGSGDNFGMVNEYLPSSGINANTSTTANQIDSFEYEDAPIPSGTVVGIQHLILTNRDAAGARTIAPFQRSGSSDYVGTTSAALTTTTTYVREVKTQNPDTSANWTLSGLNAAEFGYKLIS